MSRDDETQANGQQEISPSVIVGLSTSGGAGIALMIVAAGIGVVEPNVDSSLVGLLLLAGLATLIISIGAWFMVTEPHKHFDDISQPLIEDHQTDH